MKSDSEKYLLWYKTTILMQIVLAHGKNWLGVIHRELRRTKKMFRFNKILFEDSTKMFQI